MKGISGAGAQRRKTGPMEQNRVFSRSSVSYRPSTVRREQPTQRRRTNIFDRRRHQDLHQHHTHPLLFLRHLKIHRHRPAQAKRRKARRKKKRPKIAKTIHRLPKNEPTLAPRGSEGLYENMIDHDLRCKRIIFLSLLLRTANNAEVQLLVNICTW